MSLNLPQSRPIRAVTPISHSETAMTDKRTDAMPARPAASQDSTPMLTLDNDLTIRQADALKTALLPLVAMPRITVDAREVGRVDTAALQVLAAFAEQRNTAGRATDWQGCDGPVVDAARLLGLCKTLGLHALPAANEVH